MHSAGRHRRANPMKAPVPFHLVAGLLFVAVLSRAEVLPFTDRSTFSSAAPAATNVINFENHSGSEGYLPGFTELGFARSTPAPITARK